MVKMTEYSLYSPRSSSGTTPYIGSLFAGNDERVRDAAAGTAGVDARIDAEEEVAAALRARAAADRWIMRRRRVWRAC